MTTADDDGTRAARVLWQLLEPVHAVTYFAPEARAAADAIGMLGFFMGYVAQRAAPLGPVGPAVVAAAFHGWHPSRIHRALPDAWDIAPPAAVLRARLAGADAALRRLWGDATLTSPALAEAADLAWDASRAAEAAGRVLGAANQALPDPGPAHLRLWQAATTLREARGDGHVAALVAAGVGPAAAHLLKAAAGDADGETLRTGRKWDQAAWDAAAADLRGRGWLDEHGRLTPGGKAGRDAVEHATDVAAAGPWLVLGAGRTRTLARLLRPLAGAVVEGGTLPVPNPIGLSWPPGEL